MMIVVDRLSKMVHLIATKQTATAQDIAQIYQDRVFALHGLPDDIVSDRDTRFTSACRKNLQKLLGTNINMSTAFHPQTDGQTERMNSVLEDMLRHYVSPDQQDWDLFFSLAEFCMNNCYKTSIQCTPFQLVYGKNPKTPSSAHLNRIKEQNPTATLKAKDMHEHLEKAKACMIAAQNRDKAYADKKTRPQSFEVGQRVLLSTNSLHIKQNNLTKKLLSRYVGPFKILNKMGSQAYELELPPTMKIHDVFHVSLLKHYHEEGNHQPSPVTILMDGEQEHEVQIILDYRQENKRSKAYLVRWTGYGPEHDTWEPEAALHNCQKNGPSILGRAATKELTTLTSINPQLLARTKKRTPMCIPGQLGRRPSKMPYTDTKTKKKESLSPLHSWGRLRCAQIRDGELAKQTTKKELSGTSKSGTS